MTAPADLLETYTDTDGAKSAAAEWRTSSRVERVRTVRRTVRAFGATNEVHVVGVWFTAQARAMGWDK